MAASSNYLPQDLLKVLFDYDPLDGRLLWKIKFGESEPGDCAGYNIARKPGQQRSSLYLWFGGHQYSVHVLIWIWMTGEPPKVEVDHENRDNNDNRWANLREATRAQNQTNTGLYKNNKCGQRGVHQAGCRWRAMISVNGQNRHIGYFDTKIAAASAWLREARAMEDRGHFVT